MFDINTTAATPIWLQIDEGMRRMIALGALSPGDAVPSVRELARELRINPNTVARAYQRLTDAGVFAVRRGEGTFVAETPAQMRRAERSEVLRDAAGSYAGTALAIGASLEEAHTEIDDAWKRVARDHRRKG